MISEGHIQLMLCAVLYMCWESNIRTAGNMLRLIGRTLRDAQGREAGNANGNDGRQ